jgi:hypothetical protein
MIASQFNLDHRLAELRRAGADACLAQAVATAGRSNGAATHFLGHALRSLFGASASRSRHVGIATQ